MPVSAEALDRIKSVLGNGGFIDEPARMEPYLVSWRNGWHGKSPLIALAATTQQVAEIVGICHQHHIPIVPQGGNTGLVGGCIPSPDSDQIVINLSRMNKIREIDAVGATVIAEAGVILQTLRETAADAGFLFPVSMASEGSAQIGGAVATNAGGTAVLRYGNMREMVLGLEVVLPDGKIIPGLRRLAKDNAGYNLNQFFIGSEGTLGIVTAAALKLFPLPQQSLTSILAIPSPDAALELLGDFRGEAAEYLTAFEIMAHHALELVVKHLPGVRLPFRDASPFYLLVELASSSANAPLRALFESAAAKGLESGAIRDAVLAESAAQAKQLWALRENISESMRRAGPGIHFDISLPLAQLADFLRQMEPRITALAPGLRLAPFGHIGDGNIHYNMYVDPAPKDADFVRLKKQAQDMVYAEIGKRQGSISAEHGIGIDRKAELLVHRAPAEIELMRALKRAFDPQGIMNPGKVIQAPPKNH